MIRRMMVCIPKLDVFLYRRRFQPAEAAGKVREDVRLK